MYSYTVEVDNGVAQVTVADTPDGDGTVAYRNTDGTALADADTVADGQQVDLSAQGGKSINVVVSHTDGGTTTTQTYAVRVIRTGTVATDRAALMALYNSAGGANWGTTQPLNTWYGVFTDSHGRVNDLLLGGAGLTCSGENLVGTLPAALGNLDQVPWSWTVGALETHGEGIDQPSGVMGAS